MTFHETELIKKSRQHAAEILQTLPDEFYYHNLVHTEEVVAAAIEIGKNSGLTVKQIEDVVIAAWYHDLGYSKNVDNHEEESVKIMEEQLLKWKQPKERIQNIAALIRATKIPQSCPSLESKVLCDADLYHLSHKKFEKKSEDLRKEINALKNLEVSREEWRRLSLNFLSTHNYFTKYAQENLGPKKEHNLEMLKDQDQ
ncbi:MAG: HD domain-containing protein [Candidatus Cyclobacteriaceae bacterium M2_1C_046]